jgi:hypothetical protein
MTEDIVSLLEVDDYINNWSVFTYREGFEWFLVLHLSVIILRQTINT